jgi:hypothetical protein
MRLTLVIVALLSVAHAQKLQFTLTDRSIVLQRLQPVPATVDERRARLEQLFADAGCPSSGVFEQKIAGQKIGEQQTGEQKNSSLQSSNIICRLEGKTHKTIIVGANYGIATPDGWSAATLLPSLYQAMAVRRRRHTYLFVAFADDHRTLAGSQFFAASLTDAQAARTDAMINLDALGLSPTKVSTQHSDPELVQDLFVMVYTLKIPASQVDLSRSVNTDAEPFNARHIRRITLHSLTLEEVTDLKKYDPAREFRPGTYYNSYHLICGYLVFLDERLKSQRHHG